MYANTRYRDINQVRSQKDFRRSGDKNWRRRVEGEKEKERGKGGMGADWIDGMTTRFRSTGFPRRYFRDGREVG